MTKLSFDLNLIIFFDEILLINQLISCDHF